ncbi:MAG: S8 family serine peptidase [Nitrospirae bacterium]|nr:S8 family serine peptidase [Nitrospirota bacterium]
MEEAKAAMESLGAIVLKEEPDFRTLEIAVEEGKITRIAQEDISQWIEDVPPPPVPHNDGIRTNTGVNTVQASPYNLSGSGVNVGQWDDGDVDSTHDDFGSPSRVTEVSDIGITGDHATHVAGTMGGDGTRSSGTYRGMAPNIRIFSYDFGGNRVSQHNQAINTYGIEISNNSWGIGISNSFNNCDLYGDYAYDAPSYDQIVTGLYGKRISIIFSAGNERDDGDCPNLGQAPGYPYYGNITPPATAKDVITVGAINSDNNSMTYFSSWGPMDDGRIKPDVVAPGDEVGGDGAIRSTIPTDTYGLMIGTSMAAPAVSGSAALIVEDYRRSNGGTDPLPSTVKTLIVPGAQDLGNTGPDFSYGYGRIDVKNAIDLLESGGIAEDEVGHQASNFFYLDVPAGTTSVKVTLVWDDEVAANNASVTLVNDLDLIVKDPNGVRYYPWTLDPLNPSGVAVRTMEDHTNNIEQVEASGSLTSGTWTVEVFGYAVPVKAPQKYSPAFTPVYSLLGVSVSPKSNVYDSVDIPKGIPSGNPGIASALTIPGELIISGLQVYVDISRPTGQCCWYRITLTSPSSTTVVLLDSVTSSQTFQTWFDTQTATKEPLNRFVGEKSIGIWSLNVIDRLQGNTATLNNWGVEILTRSWAIGTAVAGTTKTMTYAERFTVQNIGNTAETFSLQITNTGPWSAASTAGGNGADTFVMSGIFSAVTDSSIRESDFNTGGDDDVIPSSSPKKATSTDIANSLVATKDGANVPAGDSRGLWLQFKAPTESAVPGSQNLVVTVGAMPP